jgi:hypothetical protein
MDMETPHSDNPGHGRMQDNVTHVVKDNPRGPSMASDPAKALGAPHPGMATMAAAHDLKPPAVAAGALAMAPFKEPSGDGGKPPRHEGDMRPHDTPGTDAQSQGYLRLRVRVSGDQMRIVGAARVEGPLAHSDRFVGEHAYEVMLDGRMLSREGLPDIGVSRSYPRPDGVEHNITPRTTVEFNVRVPLGVVADSAMARMRVSLYRFPDATPRTIVGTLTAQLGPQAMVVARIDGLATARIEEPALEQLRKLLPAAFKASR